MPQHTDIDSPPPAAPGPTSPVILLFYDGYERKARSDVLARQYHNVRGVARALWRRMRGKQVNTGFYAAFLALVDGLRQLGCEVRINDFAMARAQPDYPIGVAGYPDVLQHVDVSNPTIFGPGDPGYPDTAGEWARQAKVRHVIQPSDWFVDYYRPYCGDKMLRCPVGIDTDLITDARDHEKTIDVLIYDKIRWYRDTLVPAVRDRLIAAIEARGLSYRVLDYGGHTQDMYFDALRGARSMAFLCEHETQGLACEEAMAMNVPVFAWEEGRLVDPRQLPFAASDLRVSSVPYFDETCGRTFTLDDLESRFDGFWQDLPGFHPRDYVMRTLPPAGTARVYRDAYASLIPAAATKASW